MRALIIAFLYSIVVLATQSLPLMEASNQGILPADTLAEKAGELWGTLTSWLPGSTLGASGLALPINDALVRARENLWGEDSVELLRLHTQTTNGLVDFVRELFGGSNPSQTSTSEHISVADSNPLALDHASHGRVAAKRSVNEGPDPRRSRSTTAVESVRNSSSYVLPHPNMTCGGVGIWLPDPTPPPRADVAVYTCNDRLVSQPAHAVILSIQTDGATPASALALSALLAQAAAAAPSSIANETSGSLQPPTPPPLAVAAFVVLPGAPLPANWSAGLTPAGLFALTAALNMTAVEVQVGVSRLLGGCLKGCIGCLNTPRCASLYSFHVPAK
jgi:hypothetical protein